jgi:hypothetical protein
MNSISLSKTLNLNKNSKLQKSSFKFLNLFALVLIFLFLSGIAFSEVSLPSPFTISKIDVLVSLNGSGEVKGLLPNQSVKLQVPLISSSSNQTVITKKNRVLMGGSEIMPDYFEDEFGNAYSVFNLTANGTFNFEFSANVISSVKPTIYDDSFSLIQNTKINAFANPSELIESDSSEIETISSALLNSDGFLTSLNKAITWTNRHVTYASGSDFQEYYYFQKSALETLFSSKGVCDEFSNLAASVLRAKKIPTRIVSGIVFNGKGWDNHAWIESYSDKLGWVASDPTFWEIGFVDASHIKMGIYDDIKNSLIKTFFPENATVTYSTEKRPNVVVNSYESFSEVELSVFSPVELIAGAWNEVNVSVRNKTDKDIAVPIYLLESYDCFDGQTDTCIFYEPTKKFFEFKPLETKLISFKVYANAYIQLGKRLDGNFTVLSFNRPAIIPFTIKQNASSDNGFISVIDFIPIYSSNKVEGVLTVLNGFKTEKNFSGYFQAGGEKQIFSELLPALSIKKFKTDFLVDNNSNSAKIIFDVISNSVNSEKSFSLFNSTKFVQITDTNTEVVQKVTPIEIKEQAPEIGLESTLVLSVSFIVVLMAGIIFLFRNKLFKEY